MDPQPDPETKANLEFVKVDLVHALAAEDGVELCGAGGRFREESSSLGVGDRGGESCDVELCAGGKVGRKDEGSDGGREGRGEGVDVGGGKEVGVEVLDRGEEDSSCCGRGSGGEGEEGGDVGEEVGRQDELLLGGIVRGGCGVVLVELGDVEADEVTTLVLSVQPVLERVPRDLGRGPIWLVRRD